MNQCWVYTFVLHMSVIYYKTMKQENEKWIQQGLNWFITTEPERGILHHPEYIFRFFNHKIDSNLTQLSWRYVLAEMWRCFEF